MDLSGFKKLSKRDFQNGTILDEIYRAFVALEEYQKHNPLRNDHDAYLFHLGNWALCNENKPNKKDYGL